MGLTGGKAEQGGTVNQRQDAAATVNLPVKLLPRRHFSMDTYIPDSVSLDSIGPSVGSDSDSLQSCQLST
jgi:hypothetical protein